MEEGLFPSSRSAESLADLEEERRLMYVAITRAKRSAMLSFAEMRRVWGKTENTTPSRFLREIDEEYLDANFHLAELRGRRGYERADADLDDDNARPRMPKPQQCYDTRRGEVPLRHMGGGSQPQRPRPEIIATPKPIDPTRTGMRSVGVRCEFEHTVSADCEYRVGERVEHPKFGAGSIERIEALATDHKLVVEFDHYGSKTLLAKFAKLRKL